MQQAQNIESKFARHARLSKIKEIQLNEVQINNNKQAKNPTNPSNEKTEPRAGSGWYDEEEEEITYESASMDKAIENTNIGYKLLLKMGWAVNKGLGKNLNGMCEPLKIEVKQDLMGLGKKEIDNYWTDPDKVKRKTMEVEKEETPAITQARKDTAEKEEKIKQEQLTMTNSFYCELCDKRYKRISEYESHSDSYDHHHKKRLLDMQKFDGMLKQSSKKKQEEKMLKRQMDEAEKRRDAILAQHNSAISLSTVPETNAPAVQSQRTEIKFGFSAAAPKKVPIKFGLRVAKK